MISTSIVKRPLSTNCLRHWRGASLTSRTFLSFLLQAATFFPNFFLFQIYFQNSKIYFQKFFRKILSPKNFSKNYFSKIFKFKIIFVNFLILNFSPKLFLLKNLWKFFKLSKFNKMSKYSKFCKISKCSFSFHFNIYEL